VSCRKLIPALLLLVAVGLTGCRGDERALKLPELEQSVRAAGLHDLRIGAQRSAREDLRNSALGRAVHLGSAPDGPDFVLDRRSGLFIVRFGTVREAAHAVPTTKAEHRNGLSAVATRVCNVLVVNYRPEREPLRRTADRVISQIRRQCQ
jgi:hypothetical protein